MALTPFPVTQLPGSFSEAGVALTWTPGDPTNHNEFASSGREVLAVYNSDVPTAGVFGVALGAPSAGTFTLTYGGQTTGTIAYDASQATIQAALNALTSAPAGGFTVVGNAPSFLVYGPSGVVLTALTGTFSGLTGGAGTIATGQSGSTGTAHQNTVKSAADNPFGRFGDIVETIAAGAYRVYEMFPSGGWAVGGNIEVDPADAHLLYAVLRVP